VRWIKSIGEEVEERSCGELQMIETEKGIFNAENPEECKMQN